MMTRKEALEVMRKNMPTDRSLPIYEALQTLIPELTESEDERVRKALIDGIRQIRCKNGVTQEQMLAWLEKQKEQKPIFKKGDKVIWDDEEFNILDVNETEYNVGGYRVPFSRQNELHPIWQKSAEWSEEDTEMYINVASSLRGYACGLENEEHKKHIKKELDWLENRFQSLRPSWKPSEEQMEILQYVCTQSSHPNQKVIPVLESLYNDLKKL